MAIFFDEFSQFFRRKETFRLCPLSSDNFPNRLLHRFNLVLHEQNLIALAPNRQRTVRNVSTFNAYCPGEMKITVPVGSNPSTPISLGEIVLRPKK